MNDRDALLGGAARPKRKWGVQETEDTQGLDNRGVMNLQEQQIKQQDDVLDVLSESIGRQKQIAGSIGTAVDHQNVILDEMHEKTDRTGAKLRNTTRRVEKVTKKAQTRCLWTTICVLFLGLIGIIVAAYLI